MDGDGRLLSHWKLKPPAVGVAQHGSKLHHRLWGTTMDVTWYNLIYIYMEVYLQPDPFQSGTGSLLFELKMEHEELYIMMIYHDNIISLWEWWYIMIIVPETTEGEREREIERELLHVLIHDPRLTSLGSMQLPQPLTGFSPMPCVVIKRNSAEFEAAAAAVAQITVQTCLFRRSKAFW